MNKLEILLQLETYKKENTKDKYIPDITNFVNTYPTPWDRELRTGHLTCSAWIVQPRTNSVLLLHHKKLNIWVQLGGHIEKGDYSLLHAAQRELYEETGLHQALPYSSEVFDIDIHDIPSSKNGFPAHLHYDIRYAFKLIEEAKVIIHPEESNDFLWIPLDQVRQYTQAESIDRMVSKTQILLNL